MTTSNNNQKVNLNDLFSSMVCNANYYEVTMNIRKEGMNSVSFYETFEINGETCWGFIQVWEDGTETGQQVYFDDDNLPPLS